MRVPLTIAGLPELESMSSEERSELLRRCGAPGPVRIWIWSFTRGLFLTAILLIFLNTPGMREDSETWHTDGSPEHGHA